MSHKLIQFNAKLVVTSSEFVDSFTPEPAIPYAQVTGLLWNIWTINSETGEAGGVTLFEDEESLKNYMNGPLWRAIQTCPDWKDMQFNVLDILVVPSTVTRAPLGTIAVKQGSDKQEKVINTAQETVQKNIKSTNERDSDAFTSTYAPNAIAYDPFYPECLVGRETILKDKEDFITAFPDLQAKVNRVINSPDGIAVEMELLGTNLGPLATPEGEIPPTSQSLVLRMARFFRFNSFGEITEDHRYYDTASIIQQLGLG